MNAPAGPKRGPLHPRHIQHVTLAFGKQKAVRKVRFYGAEEAVTDLREPSSPRAGQWAQSASCLLLTPGCLTCLDVGADDGHLDENPHQDARMAGVPGVKKGNDGAESEALQLLCKQLCSTGTSHSYRDGGELNKKPKKRTAPPGARPGPCQSPGPGARTCTGT